MALIILLHIFLGVLVVVAIVAIITIIISKYETKYFEKHPLNTIFLGKLPSNKTDDVEKATEYLKLTNSIKDGIL